MRKHGLFLSAVLCLALSAPAVAADDTAYTVGNFAVGLAEMVTGRPDYSVEDAARMLRGIGYEIGEDLESSLKEQEFVDLLNRYGIELNSASPDQVVTRDTADALFGLMDSKDTSFTESHGGTGAQNSIKCKGNSPSDPNPDPSFGQHCFTDADCPGGFCKIPDGQAKKFASPVDP